jgi:ABC-type sugar transport system permease subunit
VAAGVGRLGAPAVTGRPPASGWRLSDRGTLLLFLAPALLLLLVTQAWPLAYSAWFSLFDWTLARSPRPGAFVGFGNYAKVLADPVFRGAVTTTLTYATVSTACQLVLGFALANLALGERFALQLSRALLVVPMVIAPVAVGTMWRMLLSAQAGPVNEILRRLGLPGPDWLGNPDLALLSLIVVDVWQWTPFVMVVYVAALASLPSEPFQAAAVDGATRWQTLWNITLPLLKPVTILLLLFRFIDSLLTLDLVVTTTFGGPGFRTHTLSFWIYEQGLRYFNISTAAAASWLLLLACLVLAALLLAWRRRAMRWLQ